MSLLSVKSLSFAYRASPDERHAPFSLRNVDLELSAGELLGVLGPNGGGKSTLLRLICRGIRPDGGRIELGGADVALLSHAAVARRVALVPQEISAVFSITVEQMVALGRFPHNRWLGWLDRGGYGVVEQALRDADLWDLRHRLVPHLSGGEKRRVLLARALAQEPAVLLLDEPTAHLDPRHQVEFIGLVEKLRRERGVAVIAVLHDLNLALAWCPRILALKDGTVAAQGLTREIFSAELVQDVFGVRADVTGPADARRRVDFFPNIQGGPSES